jgi:integrase/recombinase XerD
MIRGMLQRNTNARKSLAQLRAVSARRFRRPYVRHVKTFAALLGRSPDTATSEDLRRFQLHMAKQQMSAGSINAAIAALRFFFTVTLERP